MKVSLKVVNALESRMAFTLVELLTALSIGAVLFGLIFFMFVSMNRYSRFSGGQIGSTPDCLSR